MLRHKNLSQIPKLRALLAGLAIIAAACGGDDVTINDDGVSAGGVEIDTIEPANGPLPGGQMITITGTGFAQGGTQVAIGDSIVDAAAVISANELQVRTPPGVDPAAVDVVVFTSVGFASRTGGYSYNPLPTVTAVTENRGPADGGNTVTVTGTGFQALNAGDNSVEFGPYTAAATVVSDTELTVTAPSSAFPFEIVDVAVTNSNGTGSLAQAYRYFSSGFIAARSQIRQLPVGELHFVSAVDGSSRFIAETRTAEGAPLFFTAMTFDPANGVLLGFDRLNASLYSIDIGTGVGTLIGPLGTTTIVGGMSFRGGVLYGNRRAPNTRLIAIDKTNGAEIEFNTENVSCCGNSLATTPNATQTFVTIGPQLQEVDVATGALIAPTIPFTGSNIRGLAFLNNELFGFQRTNIVRRGGGGGGGPDARSVLVKLNLGTQTLETISIVPRFCAMAALPE